MALQVTCGNSNLFNLFVLARPQTNDCMSVAVFSSRSRKAISGVAVNFAPLFVSTLWSGQQGCCSLTGQLHLCWSSGQRRGCLMCSKLAVMVADALRSGFSAASSGTCLECPGTAFGQRHKWAWGARWVWSSLKIRISTGCSDAYLLRVPPTWHKTQVRTVACWLWEKQNWQARSYQSCLLRTVSEDAYIHTRANT